MLIVYSLSDESSDDEGGPMPEMPPVAVKARPVKVLKGEEVLVQNLPVAKLYEKSFMHK